MNNILVCGGGSGGHVYPALALLDKFKQHSQVANIGFVGTKRNLESKIFRNRQDIEFFPVSSQHLRGGLRQKLGGMRELATGVYQAFGILKKFQPSLVIGTGGYSSIPMMFGALYRNIPTAIVEPNVKPGLANRLLGLQVDHIFCHPRSYFDSNERVSKTGVPLRCNLFDTECNKDLYKKWGLDPNKKTLLVLGGSLGAKSLNQLALGIAKHLPLQVILSLGTQQSDTINHFQQEAKGLDNVNLFPYIKNMNEALALADVAVCRAGALTLAEMSARGIPAITVPWEGSADSHQLHNARTHEAQDAGIVIREADMNLYIVLKTLKRMLKPKTFEEMHRASLAIGTHHRYASTRILKEVEPYLYGQVPFYRDRRRRHERAGQGFLAAASPATRV